MKIGPYVEKLEQSEQYKEFINKYPDAFLIAGFFIIDLETKNNMHQIDFYVPSQKKIAAFSLDGGVQMQLLEAISDKMPGKLDIETNIDLDALAGILADEMHNRGISERIRKIIAVLQNIDGRRIWNLNCVLTGMEILRSHIEDESKSVLKIEVSSFLDLMKQVPVQKAVQQTGTKTEISEEIKKLGKLKMEIEKEEEKLKKQLSKKREVKTKKIPD